MFGGLEVSVRGKTDVCRRKSGSLHVHRFQKKVAVTIMATPMLPHLSHLANDALHVVPTLYRHTSGTTGTSTDLDTKGVTARAGAYTIAIAMPVGSGQCLVLSD